MSLPVLAELAIIKVSCLARVAGAKNGYEMLLNTKKYHFRKENKKKQKTKLTIIKK